MSNQQRLKSQNLPNGFTDGIEYRPSNHIRFYLYSQSRIDQLTRLYRRGKPFNIFCLGFKASAKVAISYLQPFSLDTRFSGYVDLVLLSKLRVY